MFRASSLYDRNREYFEDFQADLKKHLLVYLQGPERSQLQASSTIKPDINDWTVTDLYGSYPQLGGSMASNSAALLDATGTSTKAETGGGAPNPASISAPSYGNSNRIVAKSSTTDYVSPELIIQLQEIKLKQDKSNLDKARVTLEELGEVPVELDVNSDSDSDDQEND